MGNKRINNLENKKDYEFSKMSSTPSRVKLEQWLTDCLGFDDGVSDVLDYLLEIESSEDLYEYLSQLLGIEDDKISKFVDDLGRFQRGEELIHLEFQRSTTNIDDKKPSANNKQGEDEKVASSTNATTKNNSISSNRNNNDAIQNTNTKQQQSQSKLSSNSAAFI